MTLQKGFNKQDSWPSVVPSLCILITVRDFTDNLKGRLLFSLLLSASFKPNYSDFNHTVFE